MSNDNENVQTPDDEKEETQTLAEAAAEKEEEKPKKKRYSRKLKSLFIEIEQKDGKIKEYEVREMTQGQKEDYQSKMRDKVVYNKQGIPLGIQNFRGQAAELLTRCVYDVASGRKVVGEDLATWPTTTVEGMMEDAITVNGFDREPDKSREEAKKD